ncbi:unnamed protein product [Acanthoscelides obtectus]|uniref:Uncharacterized protein n=1 Tax=Acanthoscelides obtectus TaxID=200917 RepID=A0A9P0QGV5_ACAOB|nr:unnamed protein product [Acanthoscelides obtectus]CAK1689509.1 hypothetical protein AOBTE_LOCUS37314 [Acanthoscelides obtectus]
MAVLRIPSEIVTITRNKVDGLTALCILLRRLAYPNRLCDMVPMFHLSTQSLSQIINKLISVIMEEHAVLLNNLNSLQWFNREKLEYYAQAIHNKGAPMNNCWVSSMVQQGKFVDPLKIKKSIIQDTKGITA